MPSVLLTAGMGAIGVASGSIIFGQAVLGTIASYYSYSQQQKAKKAQQGQQAQNEITGITQMVRSSASPKKIIYGKDIKYSGTILFNHQSESNKNVVYLAIGISPHDMGDVKYLYVQEDKLSLSTTKDKGTYSWDVYDDVDDLVNKDYGYTVQARYANSSDKWDLVDAGFLAEIPELWTEDHKIQGNSCLYVKLSYDQGLFPHGIPSIAIVSDGKKVIDVNDGVTLDRSSNPSNILYDLLTNTDYGIGIPEDTIDILSFKVAKTICDQLVDGEKRYEFNGYLDTAATPKTNIQKILDTCAGRLVFDKEWRLLIGYQNPVITLNESHLTGSIEVEPEESRANIFNVVKGIYTNEDYLPDEYPQVTNQSYQDIDGESIPAEFDFPAIRSKNQARRVANIILEKSRNEATVKYPCNIKILQVRIGDTVFVDNARMGWTAKTFEVKSKDLSFSDGSIHGSLILKSTQASDYDDIVTSPSVQLSKTNLPDFTQVITPKNLVVTESQKSLGTVPQTWVSFSWDQEELIHVKEYNVRYKEVGGEYISQGSFESNSIDFPISESGDYLFEVQSINSRGHVSPYVQVSKSITGLEVKPDDVVFGTCIYSKNLELTWSQDTKPYFDYTEVRLDNNFGLDNNNLLYKGKSNSFVIDGTNIASFISLRGITVYAKHYNSKGLSSNSITTKALSNTKPQAPTFTHKINNNIVHFEIDRASITEDTLGFRLYKSDTSGGTFLKVSEIDAFSSSLSFVIPFDSEQWDGVESITKYFKISAFDILTDIKNDESQSTSSEVTIQFKYLDQRSLSVSSMSDLRNIQLFKLQDWQVPGISLLAQIDFSGNAIYNQTLTLEKTKSYSISWVILAGNPTLSFIANSVSYQLSNTNLFQRFTIGSNDEDITFTITGVNLDSVSQMMINEGSNSHAYILHRDDEPIQRQTKNSLNVLTSQIGQVLKTIDALNSRVDEQGATILKQDHEISLRVQKGKIVSEISLNEQGAKISGKNLVLDGFTKFINSQKVVYGEVTKVVGSIATVSVGSVKNLDPNGELFQEDSSFTYSSVSIDKDSGEINLNVSGGSASLGFYASDNVDSTSIDGGMIATNSIYGNKIVSKSIGTDQLKAEQIFTDRLEVNGYHNIILSGDQGIVVFSDNAINTKFSTASTNKTLEVETHGLSVGDFIKVLDGNHKNITKKVTISSGNTIGFSSLETPFDSQIVKVQLFKKEGQDYTAITNGKIELVSGGSPINYNDWSQITGAGKPQSDATNDSDKFTANILNIANTPEDAKNANVTTSSIGAETPTGAQSKADTAKSEAISTASSDATTKANNAQSTAISTALSDASTKANTAESNAISTASADATSKASTAESNAISTASSDATTKANNAKSQAIADLETTLQKILDNNSPMTGTFINGNSIISPIIAGIAGYFSGTLKVGTTGSRIVIDGVNKTIGSEDYDAGVTGWQIKGNGDAQFNNVAAVTRALNYSEVSMGSTHFSGGYSWTSSSNGSQISIDGDATTNQKRDTRIISCKNINDEDDFKKIITSFFYETVNGAHNKTKTAQLTVLIKTKKADDSIHTQTITSSVLNLSTSVFTVDEIIETDPDDELKDSLKAGRTIWMYSYVTVTSFDVTSLYKYYWKSSSCSVQFEYLADTTNI